MNAYRQSVIEDSQDATTILVAMAVGFAGLLCWLY